MLSLIVLLVTAIAIYYFFFVKRNKSGSSGASASSHAEYDAMQEEYNTKKYSKDENLSLTKEEKIELSWAFLTRIAEQVLGRFTRDDKYKVYDAGQKMNKHGAVYQHDVNREVKISTGLSKSKTIKKDKNVQQAR